MKITLFYTIIIFAFLSTVLYLFYPYKKEIKSQKPVSIAWNPDCTKKERTFDESHMVYSKSFSQKYDLPEEDIVDMPEYLQAIEFIIRTENDEPRCYLNFSLDDRSDIFLLPNRHTHLPRSNSVLGQKLISRAYSQYLLPHHNNKVDPRPPKMEIGYFTYENAPYSYNYTLQLSLHDLIVIPKESVMITTHVKCRGTDIKTLAYLLIERQKSSSNFKHLPLKSHHRKTPDNYVFIAIPHTLLSKIQPSWDFIFLSKVRPKACIKRNKPYEDINDRINRTLK